MKHRYLLHITLTLLLYFCTSCRDLAADYTFYRGKLVNVENVPTMPPEDHLKTGKEALEKCDYEEAVKNFNIVINCFPKSPTATEAYYFLGVAYFYEEDFDFSNTAFSEYLKIQANPTHFQEALEYKLAIAEKFKQGAKKHMFDASFMPKWAPAKELAIEVYNEVIAAVPCHEMAIKAMFAKASLQWEMGNTRQSIETFQLLTKRFPTHELAPEAFLAISHIYYEQSISEFQNPDLLSLAQINCQKFRSAFPRDERVQQSEAYVSDIKEVYAKGLYDTGRFYERKSYPKASIIYYRKALTQFPDTSVAALCQERLDVLKRHEKQG